MLTRRTFLVAGVAVSAAPFVEPMVRAAAASGQAPVRPNYILDATAVTQVFGNGLRLVAIAIRHDRAVQSASLDPALYSVEKRTVLRVFAATSPDPASESAAGDYVIVALSSDDAAAALIGNDGAGPIRRPAAATATIQVGPKAAAAPADGPPDFDTIPRSVATGSALNLVVDAFEPGLFEDPETGDWLGYNLFVPPGRDPAAALPLVLFMHDAGNTTTVLDQTLVQGLGAVAWASPEDQRRNPAIVLAPQYATGVVNDDSQATSLLDTTLHLLKKIVAEQNVDPDRIYVTGQSGGGMMSIAMMIREPELFAAGFLVACQWDPAVVAPLARQKLWVIVSEGDEKAFPGQTAIMAVIEKAGTPVSRAIWDGNWDAAAFAEAVARQSAEGRSVNFTVLRRGTVVPEGQPDNGGGNHVNTWRIAYDIPGVRNWILRQAR